MPKGDLDEDDELTEESASSVAACLIALVRQSTLADLTSLEELVRQLTLAKHIPQAVTEKLCAILGAKSASIYTRDRRDALVLLSMMGGADPAVIQLNLATIISVALGPRGQVKQAGGLFGLSRRTHLYTYIYIFSDPVHPNYMYIIYICVFAVWIG